MCHARAQLGAELAAVKDIAIAASNASTAVTALARSLPDRSPSTVSDPLASSPRVHTETPLTDMAKRKGCYAYKFGAQVDPSTGPTVKRARQTDSLLNMLIKSQVKTVLESTSFRYGLICGVL